VTGLTEEDLAALDYYESAFDHNLRNVVLADGTKAQAYFPRDDRFTLDGAWSLTDWTRDWSAISIHAAREVMTYRATKSPEEIARMFPMIRARAASRLNAETSRHGTGTLDGQVEISERRRLYANYFALDEYDLQHTRFSADMSAQVTRAVFMAADAALVLPYDPKRDVVLVVEQFRVGPLGRGDPTTWQYEPIAGRLEAGETPQQAARREAIEEANLHLGDLLPVAEVYSSPGTSSEFHYIFVGLADLEENVAGLGGEDGEHEDIRSHILSFDALMEMCDNLEAANAPLALVAYWLARHRDRIRRHGR
jgi:nudix-type nucleoside diphosphatase (YffH/AdpP family)